MRHYHHDSWQAKEADFRKFLAYEPRKHVVSEAEITEGARPTPPKEGTCADAQYDVINSTETVTIQSE